MRTLSLMKKQVLYDASPILFDQPLSTESLQEDWIIHHSEWKVEDGWLKGKNSGNWPGMAIMKKHFPGNVIVGFDAATILHTLVGFEAYASNIRIKNITVRQISWEAVNMNYKPEF